MLEILPLAPSPQIAPVIINLTDSRIKFKALSLGERDSFHLALKALIGEVRDSEVMRGGDLSAFPSSLEQQEKLLNLTEVAGRSSPAPSQ